MPKEWIENRPYARDEGERREMEGSCRNDRVSYNLNKPKVRCWVCNTAMNSGKLMLTYKNNGSRSNFEQHMRERQW